MSEGQNDQPLTWEFENDHGYLSGIDICGEDKEVLVWVDDCYHNFKMSFDKFLEIAEKVKAMEEESGRSKK